MTPLARSLTQRISLASKEGTKNKRKDWSKIFREESVNLAEGEYTKSSENHAERYKWKRKKGLDEFPLVRLRKIASCPQYDRGRSLQTRQEKRQAP